MGEVISVLNVSTDKRSSFLVVALSLAADLEKGEPEDDRVDEEEGGRNEEKVELNILGILDSENVAEPKHDKSDGNRCLDTIDDK